MSVKVTTSRCLPILVVPLSILQYTLLLLLQIYSGYLDIYAFLFFVRVFAVFLFSELYACIVNSTDSLGEQGNRIHRMILELTHKRRVGHIAVCNLHTQFRLDASCAFTNQIKTPLCFYQTPVERTFPACRVQNVLCLLPRRLCQYFFAHFLRKGRCKPQ